MSTPQQNTATKHDLFEGVAEATRCDICQGLANSVHSAEHRFTGLSKNTEFRQDVVLTPKFEHDASDARRFHERLRQVAGARTYDWWFNSNEGLVVRADKVTVLADSEFELRRLQRDSMSALRAVADELFGPECVLDFLVREGTADKRAQTGAKQGRLGFGEWLDSSGSPDKLEAGITRIVGQLPMSSGDGRLSSAEAIVADHGPVAISRVGVEPRGSAKPADSGDRLFHVRNELIPVAEQPTSATKVATRRRSAVEPSAGDDVRIGLTAELVESSKVDAEARLPSGALTVNGMVSAQSKVVANRALLADFQYGQGNELARVSIQQVLQTPGHYSPLMLVGPHGSGKTHLLEGMVNHFRKQSKSHRCVYMTAEQFTNSFVQALRGAGLPMFRRKYRDLQFLAIDDIQFFSGKKATINELQYTIDHLTRNGRQIVFAADRPPIELTEFGPELMTRCTAGLVCPLQYPDKQARYAILEQWCRQRGVAANAEVLELLASQITRDVRRLSGAINRLRAAMLTEAAGAELTVDLCQRLLQDLLVVNANSTSLSRIDQVVCEVCGIESAELKSENRGKKVSTARMLAMWLSRRYTNSALSEIGQYFGGRSHSTVIAADKRVSDWIKQRDHIQVVNASYPVGDMVQRIESKLRIG